MIQQFEQPVLPYDEPARAIVAVAGVQAVTHPVSGNQYFNGRNLVGPGQAEAAQKAMALYRQIQAERQVAKDA